MNVQRLSRNGVHSSEWKRGTTLRLKIQRVDDIVCSSWKQLAGLIIRVEKQRPLLNIKKHEYLPWNETSRRYVDDEPEFFDLQWRYRPEKSVKQGSGDVLSEKDAEAANHIFWDLAEHSLKAYEQLLAIGVAPEQARAALLIDSQTEWVWSGSLFAFAKMCNLRLDSHTQKEATEVAQKISDKAKELYPVSWESLVGIAKQKVVI